MFEVEKIRQDFPILHQLVKGNPLVYFDNAATSQKPKVVIEAIQNYYEQDNSNVHRGVHALSERATKKYEEARKKIQKFIHAKSEREIIFTRGTTESINLVAQSYGRTFLKPKDEILISTLEHHSNIVPWQLLCQQTGAVLKVMPINDDGEILQDAYQQLLNEKTKIVAISHISNSLGTINPIKDMIKLAHEKNAVVLIDGAQAAPHTQIDVQDLDCDFYVFSGHKMYAPTGIGVLYGKEKLLNAMPPYHGGGEMITRVTFEKSEYKELPNKFEAGTPNIAGAIALGVAADYLQNIGFDVIQQQEQQLLQYATNAVKAIPELKIIGNAKHKAGILSFLIDGIHAHDVGTILNEHGIAVRSGHHCNMPLMNRLGVQATTRASFAFFNTKEEIDRFIQALNHVREIFLQ